MAEKGFPDSFPGGLTVSFVTIGAVKKAKSARGDTGTFPGGLSVGFTTIGGVQKQSAPPPSSGVYSEIIMIG